MSRQLQSLQRIIAGLIIVLAVALSAAPTASRATNLIWDAAGAVPPNGIFNALGNWNDNSQFPTAGDTATFNLNSTYTVTFTANAASDALTVSAGTVNFRSNSGTVRTYNLVTGTSDLLVNGGATLSLGSAAGLPVVVNVGDRLGVGNAGNGTIVVSGAASALNGMGTAGSHFLANNGNTATLSYTNSAQGTIAGTLAVAVSSNSATRGNLNVSSDADLNVGNLQIGTNTASTATGTVTVNGLGSNLDMTGSSTLEIGGGATGNFGNLNVVADGTFSSGSGNVAVNRRGTLNIGGGAVNLNGNTTVDGGAITGTSGTLILASGKTLTARNGAQINLTGLTVFAPGTTWNVTSGANLFGINDLTIRTAFGPNPVTVDGSGSTLSATNLTVEAGGLLAATNDGVVQASQVIVRPSGEIRGNGTIDPSNCSPSYSDGCVHNSGLVSPGSSIGTLHIAGNYVQSSDLVVPFPGHFAGELRIELASASSFDKLDVAGAVRLDGTLDVRLIGGYAPQAGHSFDILDWGGTIAGRFATLNLPTLSAGLAWNTSMLYTTGVLSVVSLPGDYNSDGTVDAADYVVWRKNDGTSGGYNTWRANFGRTAGGGSTHLAASESPLASLPAVPEPAAFVFSVLGAIMGLALRRR